MTCHLQRWMRYTCIYFLAVADVEAVSKVFEVLLLFPFLSNAPIEDVEIFLCLMPGELQIILSDLHSIIAVPSPQKNASVVRHLRLFHASLGDFLLDKARSGELFIDAREAHAHLARFCIGHLPTPFLTIGMLNVFVFFRLNNYRVCCRVVSKRSRAGSPRPSNTFTSRTLEPCREFDGRTSARLKQIRFQGVSQLWGR